MKSKRIIVLLLFIVLAGLNCSVLKTIDNISRLKFRIGRTSNLELAGVSLAGKRSLNDLSALETLKLSASFIRGSLPLTFTIYVDAENPNDGTGGYTRTDATLESFPWRLFIDGKETITGNIGAPVAVPGSGEVTVIPLNATVDLFKIFKDRGYEGILNLALNLNGSGTRASQLSLFARPTVHTVLGNITYPEEIKIVSMEYSR